MRCRGCKKLKEDDALFPCRKCNGDPRYCLKCRKCDECGEDSPGDHRCGESEHVIPIGGFKVKCIDCDEFDYCRKCVIKCPCGNGEDHYLCKELCKDSDDDRFGHCCQYYGTGDKPWCTTPVCKTYCSLPTLHGDISEDRRVRLCNAHRPQAVKRMRDDFLEELKRVDKKFKEETVEAIQKLLS